MGIPAPSGEGSSGILSPRKSTSNRPPTVWCIIISMDSTILASGARKAVLLLSSAACGQRRTYHRQRSGCLGGPSKKSGLTTSRWLRRVQRPPVRQPRLGVGNPQNGESGWTWPQTMQCHSLLHHDQAHRSPDSFRSHGYSCPWLWGHQHREKGQGV